MSVKLKLIFSILDALTFGTPGPSFANEYK